MGGIEADGGAPLVDERDTVVAYAIDLNILVGDYDGEPPRDDPEGMADFYSHSLPVPRLSRYEAKIIACSRLVTHHTYSMQQSDFQRAGFEVYRDPWKVCIPTGVIVVGLGTKDRYGIFAPGATLYEYDTVEEWRARRSEYGWKNWGER